MSPAAGEKTRVAMDVTALLGPRTGVGTMVAELASRLPRVSSAGPGSERFDFTGYVASLRGRSKLGEVLPPGWTPHPLPYPARAAHRAWLSLNFPSIGHPSSDRHSSSAGRAADHRSNRGFDVIHGPNYVVPPANGAARLVTVHDLTAWRFPEMVDTHSRRFPEHLDRAIATGADVHTVSRFVADELEHELGIPPDRIHVVRNGFARRGSASNPDPTVTGGFEPGGRPYILALGTVEPRKDHIGLVRAMTELWRHHPDVRLVIAGSDGWGAEALTEEIERLGVADKVERLGYVDQSRKAALLAGAEMLAFPSRYEGFGLPILEAMGAGVPVVSTTAGAIPEVAGGAAVLVEPGDTGALAQAMAGVLDDDGARRQLIAAGERRVAEFSWDRAAEELLAVYDELAASRFARR